MSGSIKQEDIDKALEERKQREKEEKASKPKEDSQVTEITERLKSEVLDFLVLGLSDQIIKKEAGIDAKTLAKIKIMLKEKR